MRFERKRRFCVLEGISQTDTRTETTHCCAVSVVSCDRLVEHRHIDADSLGCAHTERVRVTTALGLAIGDLERLGVLANPVLGEFDLLLGQLLGQTHAERHRLTLTVSVGIFPERDDLTVRVSELTQTICGSGSPVFEFLCRNIDEDELLDIVIDNEGLEAGELSIQSVHSDTPHGRDLGWAVLRCECIHLYCADVHRHSDAHTGLCEFL